MPTAALNRVIREAQASHPAPAAKRHRARILYATQGATDPPTFTLFATHELPPTYLRYLERKIREAFDLGPTPDQAPRPPPQRLSAPLPVNLSWHQGTGRDGRTQAAQDLAAPNGPRPEDPMCDR